MAMAVVLVGMGGVLPNSELDRTKLYEDLYRHGYHANVNLTQSKLLIKQNILASSNGYTRDEILAGKRILDVGCSHGKAVEMLWGAGFRASGMDISPTAVQMATMNRVPPTDGGPDRCGDDRCFKQGSAAAIPWPDRSFDAIMSTDVLEHIPTDLVPQVAAEFARVAREKLYLAIATKGESKAPSNWLGDAGKKVELHETVRSAEWWKHQFEMGSYWRCSFQQRVVRDAHSQRKIFLRAKAQDPAHPWVALNEAGAPVDGMRMFCRSRLVPNHVH